MLMRDALKNAFIAAAMTAIIITPIFGLQLVRQGSQTHLNSQWGLVVAGYQSAHSPITQSTTR